MANIINFILLLMQLCAEIQGLLTYSNNLSHINKTTTTIEVGILNSSDKKSFLLSGSSKESSITENSVHLLYHSDKDHNTFLARNLSRRSIEDNTNNIDNDCRFNTYSNYTNVLISHGKNTKLGQWPWAAAIFALIIKYEFICGGTILTTKHVLTAGHCLKFSINGKRNLSKDKLAVALGLTYLHQWRTQNTVKRAVESYKIHPDYTNTITADSDLAILTLKMPVVYNSYIRSICLWSGSIDLQSVVSQTGYVVGWGSNEYGNSYTENQRMVKVPIVSQESCIQSNKVFKTLISNRTFCAGSRDLSGPCNGDSGSGLVLYNVTTGQFQLRGVVSRSLEGLITSCDLLNYVVYVDIAKYLPWIRNQISNKNNENIYIINKNNNNKYNEDNDKNINDKKNINGTDYSECGINIYGNVNLLIAKGRRTLPGQWPWVVALYVNYQFHCAGSLLTAKHVLIAAECFWWFNVSIPQVALGVALGRYSLYKYSEETSINKEVDSFTLHPEYKFLTVRSLSFNVAVIVFKTPVEFTNYIRPICLWSQSLDRPQIEDTEGYIVGWGRDEYGRRTNEDLQMTTMSIVSEKTCHENYPPFSTFTSNYTFCALSSDGSGACKGDLGNGLTFFDTKTGRYYLRGILSRSVVDTNGYCQSTKINLFVDVAKHLDWIIQQISLT